MLRFAPIFLVFFSLSNPTQARLVPPPTYTLNLSLPATEIWADVAKDFAPKFPKLFQEIEAKLPKELLNEIATITPIIDKYIRPQYVDEMKGISKYGNVTMERLVLLNLLYDIHAYNQTQKIPSVHVVLNSAIDPNNPIIVGNTFGWVYTPLLRDMAIVVGTKIPAQYIIRGVTFAGMVGLHSGVVAADFAASYAERKADPSEDWKTLFDSLKTGNHTSLPLVIRHKLQYDPLGSGFQSAVVDFSSFHLIAPSYILLGGWDAGEGAYITRDRFAAYDKQLLFDQETWYLVGNNKDPWVKPPDTQTKVVMEELEKIGSAVDVPRLMKILQNPQLYSSQTAFVTATTPCYWGPYTTLVYYPDE